MDSHLQSLIVHLSTHPYIALGAVFAAALLEAVAVIGTVFPGTSIVFIGGVLIGLGTLDPWLTSAVAVAGAILGDGFSYWLGHHYHDRIRGMWPMKTYPALFERGQRYFDTNGGKSIFVGRFLGPLRAIVPIVAGMSNMPPARFYAMNVLSALAWSAAHLLPGVLFGASLQVAGAVSSRLVVLLVVIVALLWAAARMVRWGLSHGVPRLAALRDRAVRYARGRPGLPARVLLSLFDPARPASRALLTAAVLLIGSAAVFLGILEDVVSNDPLVRFDRTVYGLLQRIRTEWADNVMITVTGLGGAAGSVPVIIGVSLLFAFSRHWRTLAYWLAAAGFAQIFVWMLKLVLGRARPNTAYSGFDQSSFPSGHAASSIVVYGFLAFLLARGRPIAQRSAIVSFAALAIMLVSFSRLYLGVHWFSDVAASLSFGLAWVALLGIAYTHHVRSEPLRALPLLLVVVTTLALLAGPYVIRHHAADIERYKYRPSSETMPLDEWKAGRWRVLPSARSELGGERGEPFSLQWWGTADGIAAALQAGGWKAPPAWDTKRALLWLLPDARLDELPVLPRFDAGEQQKLTFVKLIGVDERAVARLWPSHYSAGETATGEPRPLWMGTVTLERVRHPAGVITTVATGIDHAAALRIIADDVRKQGLPSASRERDGIGLLLLW